jgi:two-component system, LytTR family, response regulator
MSAISVVIVDDEPLARQKLRRLFEADRGFEVVGEAGDGEGALRVLAATRPTLVCLDIRLPGLSGLDVLRKAEPRPPAVIFTTAFDQYAVSAFELAAVDYLLKPFSRDRFLAAVERARVWIAAAHGEPASERLREVTAAGYLTRLFVRERGAVRPIRTSAVQHLESNDDYVTVQTSRCKRRTADASIWKPRWPRSKAASIPRPSSASTGGSSSTWITSARSRRSMGHASK